MIEQWVQTWRQLLHEHDPSRLHAVIADDAVFHSPVVHTPQCGKQRVIGYLGAAFEVFFNPGFRYVRQIVGTRDAMLEFETEIDQTMINGIDLITWNEAGLIVEFKVMIRPLKAINLIHQHMAQMLQSRQ